jgi:hypothetical protein
MPRRFPNEIHLEDYSAAQLAEIAYGVATEKFALTWEDGLEERLACHILEHHQHDIASQNGGLAVNLVERALSNYAARVSKSDADLSKPHPMVASDFGIKAAATFDWGDLEPTADPSVPSGTADDSSVMSSASADLELDEFCRMTSVQSEPGEATLTRCNTAPLSRAQASAGRKQTYAIKAQAASHFGGRMKMLTSEEWLADIDRLRSHHQDKRAVGSTSSRSSTFVLDLPSVQDSLDQSHHVGINREAVAQQAEELRSENDHLKSEVEELRAKLSDLQRQAMPADD